MISLQIVRKFEETTGELLDILQRNSSTLTVATPTARYRSVQSQSGVIFKLQEKRIKPDMLQPCSAGVIGEGVFGICSKALFQGTTVCVKQLKEKGPKSRTAFLHEADMLSKVSHRSVCWLIGVQLESYPFQLVTPLYTVQGIPLTYHNILFNRESPRFSSILHYVSSCQAWLLLLRDITEGLQHIHEVGLVYIEI